MIHSFMSQLSSIINSGQSRSVVLSGNIYDLFWNGKKFVPLMDFLCAKCMVEPTPSAKGILQITCELNNDIIIKGNGRDELEAAFKNVVGEDMNALCKSANGHPTMAMEFLRQLTICARKSQMKYNLLILIEAADIILPEDEIAHMPIADRRRIQIMNDWLCDPDFMNGHDSVIMISESRTQIHNRISRLPQILTVEIPSPGLEEREKFIQEWGKTDIDQKELVNLSAGLSLHALRQLLCQPVTKESISDKVEEFIVGQIGDGVVEFQRPTHTFKDVMGYTNIKKFMREEMIPRFQADPASALPGAAIGGPIGSGKTYICEALAAELGMPVLVLKNLRSKWFGETDVIFERLRRALTALNKVVIFVDEADTQFGGLGDDVHETERRLTGKIQAMMSDPALRGRVLWLLMTARIHRLSPDIRRPGRVGDLIIPILDPEGEDRKEFITWVFGAVQTDEVYKQLDKATKGYSSASFSALRSLLKSKGCTSVAQAIEICEDLIPPDIEDTRRYQTLQALINCTRKSLIPKWAGCLDDNRKVWRQEILKLESEGMK